MKTNPNDATLRNVRAQKKVNERLKAQIGSLKQRVANLERAIRVVLRAVR